MRKVQTWSQEGERAGSCILRAFKSGVLGEVSGENLHIHQLFWGVLSGLWFALIDWCQGTESLAIAAGPDVGHGITCLALLLFWAWG